MSQTFSIQIQNGVTGEWITITDPSSVKGLDIETTPTGFNVEQYVANREPITATFTLSPKVTDTRMRVDLMASYMTPRNVFQFEFVHALGGSYYARYVFRRYAAQLNHANKARAISWQRLNWKQKARAIAIADECNWYDDYYYGRA